MLQDFPPGVGRSRFSYYCDGYVNAISRYIASREGYDALLELEEMGGKIRDMEDEFKGAEWRDEETKFCFAYDCVNKIIFRVWGTTFKPALYKECTHLGVKIYDRTQATSLLTESGRQGARVVGATGLNVRTGQFTVFKAKATVMCLSRPQRVWHFSSELTGLATMRPQTNIGNGHAMAWRAGAELTQMEMRVSSMADPGDSFPQYGVGSPYESWYPCNMVDADGKRIPFVDRDGRLIESMSERYRPGPGVKFMTTREPSDKYPRRIQLIPDLVERIKNGEFKLPLYADLPSMPEIERKVIFGMMVGEEGKTKIAVLQTYTESGFDPNKDMLQSYIMIAGEPESTGQDAGGLLIDWDLKTTLEGLYAAGDQLFGSNDHHHAAATGRYAGRKAVEYAAKAAEPVVVREQVEAEKARVYAPIKRKEGIEWKELNAGICRVMQNYCGDIKNEELLNIGLLWLKDIDENEAARVYASNPHKLGRTLDVLDILTVSQIVIHASLARKASSKFLYFYRLDYPEMDQPEWRKWVTVRLENGELGIGELPIDFWGSLEENYEAHNRDYQGWYKTRK